MIMVDFNGYWDALSGTADPFEETTESVLQNSDQLGMWIVVFAVVVILIAFVLLFAFFSYRNK